MELLPASQRSRLVEFLTGVKHQLAEWLVVDISLMGRETEKENADVVSDMLNRTFSGYQGIIVSCTRSHILMLIQWGKDTSPQHLAYAINTKLPPDSFQMSIMPPTKEGLRKIALTVTASGFDEALYTERASRQGNVILIADDDMYMRSLAKAKLKDSGTVIEIADGSRVVDAYKEHNPDIVLLDIHMPGLDGQAVLAQLRAIDSKAYIVMLSADSSPENVLASQRSGARGFLAKPFSRGKLSEYVDSCPTLSALG